MCMPLRIVHSRITTNTNWKYLWREYFLLPTVHFRAAYVHCEDTAHTHTAHTHSKRIFCISSMEMWHLYMYVKTPCILRQKRLTSQIYEFWVYCVRTCSDLERGEWIFSIVSRSLQFTTTWPYVEQKTTILKQKMNIISKCFKISQ